MLRSICTEQLMRATSTDVGGSIESRVILPVSVALSSTVGVAVDVAVGGAMVTLLRLRRSRDQCASPQPPLPLGGLAVARAAWALAALAWAGPPDLVLALAVLAPAAVVL
jgi:hypothetical protein